MFTNECISVNCTGMLYARFCVRLHVWSSANIIPHEGPVGYTPWTTKGLQCKKRVLHLDKGCNDLQHTVTFLLWLFFYRDSKEDQRRFYNVRVTDVAIYITFNSALPSLLSLFIRSHCHRADRFAAMIMNHFLWLLPLVFPHPSSPVILLERSDGNLFHWNHPMKGDKLVLHRSKRDWMWRQFFLSEEYTGSNYQYVGKVSVHDNTDPEQAFLSSKQGLGGDANDWFLHSSSVFLNFMWFDTGFEHSAVWQALWKTWCHHQST